MEVHQYGIVVLVVNNFLKKKILFYFDFFYIMNIIESAIIGYAMSVASLVIYKTYTGTYNDIVTKYECIYIILCMILSMLTI